MLTLASAALGLLTLRSPPVEATIALSIVLVAGEALHKRMTLARRYPALLAFLFGLVHGLGFAGVDHVRVGKTIEFDLKDGDTAKAEEALSQQQMARR